MPDPLVVIIASLPAKALRQQRRQERLAFALLLILGVAVFLGGISWGLPSRDTDRFLFGLRAPWTGRRILQLTGQRATATNQGADVDRNPLDKNGKVVLNATAADRAQIVRRYRLFTYQPDEMVTLMALAQMHPGQGDLDPRLYQYGGLWIYPVGAMLRVAGLLHLVKLTPDLQYYLDRPEAFGRFYVVARLYVFAWAMLGAWAVFSLVRQWTRGSLIAACVACFCYIMLPVVVNMSHEAKPHLPGAVLMLLTALAASKYVRTAEMRWWWITAGVAGLAVGMVLAAWPVLIVLPVASVLVRQDWRLRMRMVAAAAGFAVAVYFATNPYVLLHLFSNRDLLRSNLGNTRDMFQFGLSGPALFNAAVLIAEGTSILVAVAGAVAIMTLVIFAILRRSSAIRHPGWLLVAPAMLVLIQFVVFAKDQPGAYGRFAIFLDLALLVAAIVGGSELLKRMKWRPELLVLLAIAAALSGSRYYVGFVSDTGSMTSRESAAQLLDVYWQTGSRSIGVVAEPAPYSVPPLNLFDWRLILLPKDYDPASDRDRPDVIVRTADVSQPPPPRWAERYEWAFVDPVGDDARMRWAAKPFLVLHVRPDAFGVPR